MNQRLIHDAAFSMARRMLKEIHNFASEEDARIAFGRFYDACKEGVELYEVQRERMLQRLKPSRN